METRTVRSVVVRAALTGISVVIATFGAEFVFALSRHCFAT
jgi:hypothetical protein